MRCMQVWKQGYKGELVKMGVFDTGIRLDHPHVKNIRCAQPVHIRCAGLSLAAC